MVSACVRRHAERGARAPRGPARRGRRARWVVRCAGDSEACGEERGGASCGCRRGLDLLMLLEDVQSLPSRWVCVWAGLVDVHLVVVGAEGELRAGGRGRRKR